MAAFSPTLNSEQFRYIFDDSEVLSDESKP